MMLSTAPKRATLAASICVDAKVPLIALAATRYVQFPQTPTTIDVRIGHYAGTLVEELKRTCSRSEQGSFADVGGCSERCRGGWQLLVDEVEKARVLAAGEGIEIVSLLPTWGALTQP